MLAPVREFLSVLARNPHKGSESEISRETRSGGGKVGPRKDEESSVDKEGQKRPLGLREQSREREGHSQQKSAWLVSGFCGSFVRLLARVNSQNEQKMSHRLPPSCAWS